jgi:SlyX protein
MSSDERLTKLEVLAAEQERTIEELSGQIAEQWKEVEALRKKLDLLTNRLVEVEANAAPEVPVTRPPHW